MCKMRESFNHYLENRKTINEPFKFAGFSKHIYNGSTLEDLLLLEKKPWGGARVKKPKELSTYEQYSAIEQYREWTSIHRICRNLRISEFLLKRLLIRKDLFKKRVVSKFWTKEHNNYLENYKQPWSIISYKNMRERGLSDAEINKTVKGRGWRKFYSIGRKLWTENNRKIFNKTEIWESRQTAKQLYQTF